MLQMAPETMRELAHHVVEILIGRSLRLPSERVWEGDFKDALVDRLDEDPPETGRPPREVVDRAAQDVLNNTLRLDHPRSFGFVPTCPTWPGVLADFMASGFNVNVPTWLVASGPEPDRRSGHRLVPAVVRTAEWGGRADDQRRGFGGAPRARDGTRGGRQSGTPGRLHERAKSQRTDPGRAHRGHHAGSDSASPDRHFRADRSGRGCGSCRRRPILRVHADGRLRKRRHGEPRGGRPAAGTGGHLRC